MASHRPAVVVLHPGSMGAGVGRQAMLGGARVRWVSAGRSAASRQTAADVRFRRVHQHGRRLGWRRFRVVDLSAGQR